MLIICAGMHYSGSTWLFNVLRYACINAGLKVQADQYEAMNLDIPADAYICKTHLFRADFCLKADYIFTTRRDLRDVVATALRRGNIEATPWGAAWQALQVIEAEYKPWVEHSNLEIPYNSIVEDRATTIQCILKILGLEQIDPAEVDRDVEKLNKIVLTRPDVSTQLWPNHRGEGKAGGYKEQLTPEMIAAVENIAGKWLMAHGYEMPVIE